MEAVSASTTIARPREEIFAYLGDIANHQEFCDHFLTDWRLTREESFGRGAGARFRMPAHADRYGWGDATFTTFEPPHRLVEAGHRGKYNRTRMLITFVLTEAPGGGTRVEMTMQTEPATPADRIMESALGQRPRLRRGVRKAVQRLRAIQEDGKRRGPRATVAAR
jgi:uncharacterized protein YndB with AHSA1/START domain